MRRGNALIYLLGTKLKNQLKSFLKSPGKLLYLVIIVLLIGFVVFSGNISTEAGQAFRPMSELTAMVFALFVAMFFLLANGGFNHGGNFFNMVDVNLIFPAPLKPQHVLFYGLCQQMGTSLVVGIFLIFQYSWLHQLYGIGMGEIIIILIGYGLTVFLGQTVALVLYSATSGSDQKRRIARTVYYLLLALIAAFVAFHALTSHDMLAGAVAACNALPMRLFPLAGWMSMAVSGALTGELLPLLLGLGLSVLGFVLMITLMTRTRTDFYEDVLKSAETVQSAITAKKQGQIGEAAPRNVKVGKTGLGKGWGASAFYYKHMVENRRSRIFLLSPMSLLFAAMTIGFGALMGKEIGPVGILAFGTYLQIFGIMLGRINKELIKPFIYMIPEPPLKKLIFALAESIPSSAVEAVVVFLPLGILLQMDAFAILCLIAARIGYAILFMAGNVAVERLWGGVSSRTVVMFLYIFTLLVVVLPGIVVAVLFGVLLSLPLMGAILILTAANLLVALLILFLCRDMLEWAELNQQ